VAVLGIGNWGVNLVRNFSGSADCDLRWVCDLDGERASASAGRVSGTRATASLDQVLDDPGVEAVAVATPAASHASLVMACLKAGRHVLVEKPMALSVREAQTLSVVAEQDGLTLMCDQTYCHSSAVRRMREVIQGGELGNLYYVDSVRVNLGRVQPDVDVFWDLAHHDLSILDFVLPAGYRPTAVSAHGADPLGAGRACLGYLTLRLTNAAIAQTHVSWLSPTKIRTTVIGGSRCTLVWNDLHPTDRLLVYPGGMDLAEIGPAGARLSYPPGHPAVPPLPQTEALSEVVREFAAAVRERRAPLTDAAAELRVLAILEAASQSIERAGAAVPLEAREA
jgi:predicted dehydrogenase